MKIIAPPYSILAEAYDEIMEDKFYMEMQEYFLRIKEKYNIEGQSVLDMCCGTGKFSITLAKMGYEVTGLDISTEMLELAHHRFGERVNFIKGDMRTLKFSSKFDMICCVYDSINYLVNFIDLSKTMNSVYRTLNKGGYFIFDVNTIYWLRKIWGNSLKERNFRKGTSIWKCSWDEKKKINTLTINFFVKSEAGTPNQYVEIHREKGFSKENIQRVLGLAGFGWFEIFECFTFHPASEGNARWMIIARK